MRMCRMAEWSGAAAEFAFAPAIAQRLSRNLETPICDTCMHTMISASRRLRALCTDPALADCGT